MSHWTSSLGSEDVHDELAVLVRGGGCLKPVASFLLEQWLQDASRVVGIRDKNTIGEDLAHNVLPCRFGVKSNHTTKQPIFLQHDKNIRLYSRPRPSPFRY